MSNDKRKGFIAGYRKAGPTLRFTIKVSILALVLALAFFLIQAWFGASKELQMEAKQDRAAKHKEATSSHDKQINMLSNIETGIADLKKSRGIVNSSVVSVVLIFNVSEETPRSFSGTIASRREKCIVETESWNKLTYLSSPGSTTMKRSQHTYEFSFNAEMPQDVGDLRELPKEFMNAQRIVIPLIAFLRIMKKKMSQEGVCSLTRTEIGFIINGIQVAKHVQETEVKLSESIRDTLYLNFQ